MMYNDKIKELIYPQFFANEYKINNEYIKCYCCGELLMLGKYYVLIEEAIDSIEICPICNEKILLSILYKNRSFKKKSFFDNLKIKYYKIRLNIIFRKLAKYAETNEILSYKKLNKIKNKLSYYSSNLFKLGVAVKQNVFKIVEIKNDEFFKIVFNFNNKEINEFFLKIIRYKK